MEESTNSLTSIHRDQLQELLEILHKLLEYENPDDVIEEFFEKSVLFLNASSATLVLWETGIGVCNYTYNMPTELNMKGIIMKPDQDSLTSRIFRDRTIVELTNYSKNADAWGPLKEYNFQYAIGTPLFVKNMLVATLCFFYYEHDGKMNDEERLFLEKMGNTLCFAFQYIQLTQKITEKTLEADQYNNFLTLVLNASPNITILCDLSGKIRFWNQAAENSTGYTSNEMINKKIPLLSSDEKKFHQIFLDVRKGVTKVNEVTQLQTNYNEDDFRILLYSIYPIRNQTGNIESILFMGQDISEKHTLLQELNEYHTVLSQKYSEISNFQSYIQQLQNELNLAQRLAMIGELSGELSHQINDPITLILNNLQLITDELVAITDNSIREVIECKVQDITFTANRIKNIMISLKQFAESTRTESVRQIDLSNVINQSLQEYKSQLQTNQIKFVKKNIDPAGTYQIGGNFLQLKRIFRFLINNAINALNSLNRADTEKVLRIYLENVEIDRQLYVRVTVHDNGCGINSEDLPRIFEPFFTNWVSGDESKNSQDIHIGLGLPTVKLVIENHHGMINVKSTLQKGTSFILDFPKSV